MEDDSTQTDQQRRAEALQEQADLPQVGLLGEFVDFLLHNKKWWLAPILLVLLLLGVLIVLGSFGAAPFIYPLL